MKNHTTKLYILTGFLGSGKTTILMSMLEKLKGKRVGIIQNEFGKLSIDGDILRNDDIQMVEITRGSIFCSCLKLSFVQALIEMAKHQFDYLFVESSGLGDPSNVEEILGAVEAVSQHSYDFSGVICTVDALNFITQLCDMETAERQLRHCNMAVITKPDLVDEDMLGEVLRHIRALNPVCQLEVCRSGHMDHSFLQEDLTIYRWADSEETTNSVENKPKTLFMEIHEPVDQEKLDLFLQSIAPHVYRVKGFAQINGMGNQQVDLVGRKIDYKPAGTEHRSELVFISRIGTEIIRELFDTWEAQVGAKMKIRN